MRHLVTLVGIVLVGCNVEQEASSPVETPAPRSTVSQLTSEPTVAITNPLDETNSPIIGVWQDSSGLNTDTNGPYLRLAVWADGRVVFARDPKVWNHDLLLGQLPELVLAKLKQDIRQTGVFDLEGHCYLVPDAPVDCVMLSFGDSQQMLYWDEVEGKSYGINIDPKPRHLAFKKAWREVNRLTLSILPHQAKKLDAHFQSPPNGWYLKRMIQSR